MRQVIMVLVALATLSGCTSSPAWSPDEDLAAVSYRAPGPASITLFTMVHNESGAGHHTGLMINASERVIFDPAGTFNLSFIPERNDVFYGITEPVRQFYETYHARITYHVVVQTVEVSPEVAEQAKRMVEANGAVMQTLCSTHTSRILRSLPGFEGTIKQRFFPERLMQDFARLPGVETYEVHETDDANKDLARLNFEAQVAQGRVAVR